MKQRTILLGSIFCVFLFCSLIYQPVIANQNLSSLLQQKEIKGSVELVKIQSDKVTDCGCNNPNEKFPILCDFLWVLYLIVDGLLNLYIGGIWYYLVVIVEDIAVAIHCDWQSAHAMS